MAGDGSGERGIDLFPVSFITPLEFARTSECHSGPQKTRKSGKAWHEVRIHVLRRLPDDGFHS